MMREISTAIPSHAHRAGWLATLFLFSVAALRPADVAPRMLLLDAATADDALVAVGERGAILRSIDAGRSWQTVPSPARATLTAVAFAPSPSTRGWAVGHDALILATPDAGRTWTKQFQGDNLADSFLDVLALDVNHVLAVGAYALCVETRDAGKTWHRRKLADEDYHFNRIVRGPTGTLYIAGEHGTLLRSPDDGRVWEQLRVPYEGSFYGVLPLDAHTLLVHGLRGHVYRSTDDGATWTQVPTPAPALLATSVRLRDNTIVLGGNARTLLASRDGGATLAPAADSLAGAVSEIVELSDGRLLTVGEAGASVLRMPK
jgi:photosystem II stability/assembly factor-like uncharacterized protein